MSPVVTMRETNLHSSLMTILGQQHERHFSCCTLLFSHSWSAVAFDHWPTRLMIGLQACLRGFAPSRRAQGRERIPVCASSFVCASPLAVITVAGFLDFRRVPSSPKLNLFGSACALKLRNLPLRRWCQHYPSFGRREELGLVLCFEFFDTFCQNPRSSAVASFLLQGFFLSSFLEFWRTRIALLRFTLLHDALRWNLSFPIFLRDVMCPWRMRRCKLIPRLHSSAE